MMTKITSLIVFLLTCSFASLAQSPLPGGKGMIIDMHSSNKGSLNIQGSPFMENEFVKGYIKKSDGSSQLAFMKFNAIENLVVFKLSESAKPVTLPKTESITYHFPDYNYRLEKVKTGKGIYDGYSAVFFEGDNLKLIGIPTIDVIPSRKARNGYEENKPSSIKVEMNYYLSSRGNDFQKISANRKDIKAYFQSDFVNTYLDENKLKDRNDLIELLKIYDNQPG